MRGKPLTLRLAQALVLALFAVNVYRAASQSITCDEAYTYNEFLAGSPWQLVRSYEASHHVLHTALAKLSISLLGASEFTLRIPSLLGGLLYLTTACRLCLYLFGEGLFFLLAFASLGLNPYLLDFLSAARGYGLALGLCLWALYHLLRYVDAQVADAPLAGLAHLHKGAVGLALSVAANLTLLPPCAALAFLLLVILAADALLAGGRLTMARQLARAADHFLAPGWLIAVLLLALPLSHARPDQFFLGMRTLRASLQSLLSAALVTHSSAWLDGRRFESAIWQAGRIVVPLVLLLIAGTLLAMVRRWRRARDFRSLDRWDRFLWFCGGAMLLSLAGLIAAHYAFGAPYPVGRSGLYFLPLFLLACSTLLARLSRRPAARWAGPLVLSLMLIQFLLRFDVTHYADWPGEAATRSMVEVIRARQALHPQGKVRVGATWELVPGLNFYRQLYKLDWMEPVAHEEPKASCDYLVLLQRDAALLDQLRLTVLHKDARFGVLLAAPQR